MQDDRLDRQQDLGVTALPGQINPATYYTDAQPQPSPQPQPQPQAEPAPAQAPSIQQTAPPVQNIYITQQVTQQQQSAPVVLAVAPKSVVLSLVLTFLFGPLGMLYSTVPGGLIMIVASLVVALFTFGIGLFVTWPICIIWGAIAASNYNTKFMSGSITQISR